MNNEDVSNVVNGKFGLGDVVDYEREREWCREGVAVVRERQDGLLVLADTYWQGGSGTHVLTSAEVATATLRFNVNDYRELAHHENRESIPREHWQDIPSQHGLSRRRFVRVDSGPTWEQKHANARQDIIDAIAKVADAISSLESARRFADYLRERETEGVKPW